MKGKEWTSVAVPAELAARVDAEVKSGGLWASRAELVRHAIQGYLDQQRKEA